MIGLFVKIWYEDYVNECQLDEAYKTTDLIFRGSQSGNAGDVSTSKAEAVRAKIQSLNPLGILFNPERIHPFIRGGCCSAMTLEVAEHYFCFKKVCQSSKEIVDSLTKIGILYKEASEVMKERQAAFNTIEVIQPEDTIDHSKNKVQALVQFHSLAIHYASDMIETDTLKSPKEVDEKVTHLPDGAFFLRIIIPASNKKLEIKGHSMLYVRENELHFLYDPNRGCVHLTSASSLLGVFNYYLEKWKLTHARFYQLQPGHLNAPRSAATATSSDS